MISKQDIEDLAFDPIKIQRKILESIANGTESELSIVDPTSPFLMLMEGNAVMASNGVQEMVANNRRIYPSLSRNMDDLYHHMTDTEERNIFATPSRTTFRLLVNVNDMHAYGIEGVNNSNKKTMTIPRDTKIHVSGYTFNIEYDVNVLLLDGKSYVEQDPRSNDNTLTDTASLPSTVSVDNENVEWIVFDLEVKQVSTIVRDDTIVAGLPFERIVDLKGDLYYYSEAYYGRTNEPIRLDMIHSDTVIDYSRPSLFVEVLDGKVKYSLPSTFISSGLVHGKITIKTYTTRGKISVNFTKTPINNFTIELPDETSNPTEAVAHNIAIICSSTRIIDGGINTRRLRDVRKKVINNTTGFNDLPITELQLAEKSKIYGFNIGKEVDTLTNRIYVATKNINYLTANPNMKTSMDIFTNRTSLILDQLSDIDGIKIINEDVFIKVGTKFISRNGTVKPMTNVEVSTLENLDTLSKIDYLNTHDIFVSPFMYVIDTTLDTIGSRIYDMNDSSMDMLTITDRNPSNQLKVNIGTYDITRISAGYNIRVNLLGNDKLAEITDFSNLYVMISLPVSDTSKYIHIKSKYGTDGFADIKIETAGYPDSDDSTLITGIDDYGNTISSHVNIKSKAKLTIYRSNRTSTIDDFTKSNNIPGDNRAITLTVEQVDLVMGVRILNLYTDLISEFTNRKYLTEDFDVYETYDNDVYLKDDSGCDVQIITDANGVCTGVDLKLLHKKGDIVYEVVTDSNGNEVLDVNGNPTYVSEYDANGNVLTETVTDVNGIVTTRAKRIPVIKRHAGDIILENNTPTINELGGINYFINILMIEYPYIVFDKTLQLEYVNGVLGTIKNWLKYDLVTINNATLEHTRVEYTPNKSTGNVKLLDGTTMPYKIQPDVVLYVDSTIYTTSLSVDEMRVIIGKILHKYFSKRVIEMELIRNEIINTMPPGIVGIKILNVINGASDKEVYSITNTSNRPSIVKKLDSSLNVIYDINIFIESV